jgi:hypothetical protein
MIELKQRAQRFPIIIPLQYRIAGTPRWLQGMSVNMSRTGILFHAIEKLPTSSPLEMRIDFPFMSRLSCRATVIRAANPSTLVAVRIQHCLLRQRHRTQGQSSHDTSGPLRKN